MGKETRRTSGKSMGGSTLIVPDQPVYSVKRFPPTFKYKKNNVNSGSNNSNTKKT